MRMQVEYDGNVLYDEFIYGMITNSNSVGGFDGLISGDVILNDGVFEVTLIKTPKNPMELSEVLACLTNIRKESDMLYTFQTSSIKFTSSESVSWTLDGSTAETIRRCSSRIVPGLWKSLLNNRSN